MTLKSFFSNPIVGVVGSIFSIIGVLLAIYFYSQSKYDPKLTYFVNPTRATIVKSGQFSKLKVLNNEEEIKNDVTAVQIAIWNRGKKSIKPSNILENFKIIAEPRVKILEASVMTVTRELINFNIDTVKDELGVLDVFWKILEKDDGVKIQLLYEGTPDVEFKLNGVIESQKDIVEYKFDKSKLQKIGIVSIVYGLFMNLLYISIRRNENNSILRLLEKCSDQSALEDFKLKKAPTKAFKIFFKKHYFIILNLILYIGLGIYLIFLAKPFLPPFLN